MWEKSLADGREAPIVADNYIRNSGQWSPDGARLAYQRGKPSATANQLMVWSSESHNEEPLTASGAVWRIVHDWSPDGKWLLISQLMNLTPPAEIWLLPIAGAPHAEAGERKIASDPAYDLYQPHFSPDGRWIALEAIRGSESTLYVMPAGGDRGLPSRTASTGTTSLAGLPMERRSTSFLAVAASSTCGESTSI